LREKGREGEGREEKGRASFKSIDQLLVGAGLLFELGKDFPGS